MKTSLFAPIQNRNDYPLRYVFGLSTFTILTSMIMSTPESRRTFKSKLAIWTHLEPKQYNLSRTSRSKYPLLVLDFLIRKTRSPNGRFKTTDSRMWKQWINQDLLTTYSGSAEVRGRRVNGADPHYTMVRRQHKVRIHLRGLEDPSSAPYLPKYLRHSQTQQ